MLTFIVIGCILTAHIQPSLPDDGQHDPDEDEPVSHLKINSTSREVALGENVTLKCFSGRGSLPINYTLYRGKDRVLPPASKNKMGEEAEFHLTINSISELGEYKCKAENKFTTPKYSPGFNFTVKEFVSHPVVYSSSTEVFIDDSMMPSCLSGTGSLSITYTLYKGKDREQHPTSKNKRGEAAEFHFPTSLISELGKYKCKAENKFTKLKYSLGFNFTMRGKDNNLVVFIVPPLLLLLLALVLAIPLLILPWCKARKLRDISPTRFVPASFPSSENDVIYTEIGVSFRVQAHFFRQIKSHEKVQEEYINLEYSKKKEKRKQVSFRDATTVAYSEVIRR